MTLRNYIIIAALGSVLAVRAQEEPAAPVFRPPFDFPLILSGNFGELRSNHFHGGVDFKTQGEVGKPIHCIADGYVSRVLVTPGGYAIGIGMLRHIIPSPLLLFIVQLSILMPFYLGSLFVPIILIPGIALTALLTCHAHKRLKRLL